MKKTTLLVALAIITTGIAKAQTPVCNSTEMEIVGTSIIFSDISISQMGTIGTTQGDFILSSIKIDIEHNVAGDLDIELNAPDMTSLVLCESNGGDDGLDMRRDVSFADDTSTTDYPNVSTWSNAATFEPIFNVLGGDNSIATVFDGTAINGDWRFIIRNLGGIQQGTLFETCLTFTDAILGTEENFASRVVLFPNPASNTLNVTEAMQTYTIYNMLGNKVLEGTGQAIDISSLSEGVYMAALTNDGKNTVEKFVVKNK